MQETVPPWNCPAAVRAGGGGSPKGAGHTIRNNGTQSYGAKVPESIPALCSPGCIQQTAGNGGTQSYWGLRRFGAMPARLPDTLHPIPAKKGRYS